MNSLQGTDNNPNLLSGIDSADDAAVYKISEDTALIQTVDFFTPIVDNPYDYGAIAAANAVSDIYAMGGSVILALNICAFPADFPERLIEGILTGGAETVAEAGGILAGGHTIDDKEPKYGLAATGTAHPKAILTKSGAKEGDILVLTKPLGTGMITTAAKADMTVEDDLNGAVASMKKLNRLASELFGQSNVHACTDVTGFGIIGHVFEIAEKSGVAIEIDFSALPYLPGAKHYADETLFPGGSRKNLDYYSCMTRFPAAFTEQDMMLLATPETSGGLLAAVAEEELPTLRRLFTDAGEDLHIIGRITGATAVDNADSDIENPAPWIRVL